MTKGELMKLVLTDEEQTYCDSAIPMHLWKTCDTSLNVFDCKNNKLVNLAERLISSGKLKEITDELDAFRTVKKQIAKAIKKDSLEPLKGNYMDILLDRDERENGKHYRVECKNSMLDNLARG